MKLHLTSAYETHSGLDTLRKIAPVDSRGNHVECASPEEADAIIFVEDTHFEDVFFRRLMNHPIVKKYPHKTFMYNEMDKPWDALPGLYCCMPRKHLNSQRHKAFAYLSTPNPFISEIYGITHNRKWLYSFMGSMSHACRRPLLRLNYGDGHVQDTSDFNVWRSTDHELEVRGRAYADVIASSHFVLCPRGIGCSSLRLYETLEAGRVPVIISDHWVPPAETDWRFGIQVEERRANSIPGLLRTIIGEAEERGNAARAAWEQSYAPNTLFNTVGNAIAELLNIDTDRRRPVPGASLHKWLASGETLTRTAAQKLRNSH